MATPRWGGLRLEPYNPNAVDADGDGIVQEGTAWERPGGTTLLDNLGRAVRTGITSPERPQGLQVVDRDGKKVTYKPTYGEAPQTKQPAGAGKPTPLAQAGAPSLKEMGVMSLKDMGLPSVQDIVNRRNQQQMTPEQIQRGWSITRQPLESEIRNLPIEEVAEYSLIQRMLNQIVQRIDEPQERKAITNMIMNSFYWGSVAFDKSGGSWANFLSTIWSGSQDAGFSPQELFEDLWQAGGNFAISLPIMRAKEKFNLTKQQVSEFTSSVKERMRQKQLQMGEFTESFKQKVRSVFAQLGRKEEGLPSFGFDFPGLETTTSITQPLATPSFANRLTNMSVPDPEQPAIPKPRYPRQPPASAFEGKAEDIFGSAETWEEFRDLMDKHDIVFLDYETTGLEQDEFGKVTGNGIPTQIGAVRMRGGKVVDRFNVYINPGVPHSEWQQWSRDNLKDQDGNPITQEFLEQQISVEEAHRQFAEWAGTGAILGMQNAIFDNEVLTRSLQEHGIDWRPDGILDTKEIADMTLPRWNSQTQDGPVRHGPDGKPILDAEGKPIPSNSLGDITRYLGVELGDKHHTADHDAEATGEVLTKIADGGIERGWSKDVLDAEKRLEKEKKNKETFKEAIKKFKRDRESWRKQSNPNSVWYTDEKLKGRSKEKQEARNKAILEGLLEEGGTDFARPTPEFLEEINKGRTSSQRQIQNPDPGEEGGTFAALPRQSVTDAAESRRLRTREYLSSLKKIFDEYGDGEPEWDPLLGQRNRTKFGMTSGDFAKVRDNPQLEQLIRDKSVDELLDILEGQASEFMSADIEIRVRTSPERLEGILTDGRYRTIHEVESRLRPDGHKVSAPTEARVLYEERLGVAEGTPAGLRPASGYIVHPDWVNDARERFKLANDGREPTEFDELPLNVGDLDGYGGVEVVLSPGVKGRSAFARGDSFNGQTDPVRFDETDPLAIANALVTGQSVNEEDFNNSVVRMLEAHVSGDFSDIHLTRGELSLKFGEKSSALHSYIEALIPGGFTVDEIDEIVMPRKVATQFDMEAVSESLSQEFFTTDKLRAMGLSEEEIAYVLRKMSDDKGLRSPIGNVPSEWAMRIVKLQEFRAARERRDALANVGIPMRVTDSDPKGLKGLDMFDPVSYGGSPGDDVEQILVDRARKWITKIVREDMEREATPNEPSDMVYG